MSEKNQEIEKLFRELYRSLKRESGEILMGGGLTNSDYLYLRTIANMDGAQASEIAQELGVRRGYISALSKRMEKMRLVQRSPVKSDGRAIRLELTPEGERRFRSMEEKVRAVLAERISRLKSTETALLLKILQTML